MPHETKKEWMDISIAIEEIDTFIANRSFSDYCSDRMLQAALERKLEIIGEALNRIEDIDRDILQRELPDYRKIIGLRNILAHGYDIIDYEIIWDLVINNVPFLKSRVMSIQENMD